MKVLIGRSCRPYRTCGPTVRRLHHQFELRPVAQDFCHVLKFFVFRSPQLRAARFERDATGIVLAVLAAEQAGERAERRSHDFRDEIADGFPDHRADGELGIVQVAPDRHGRADFSLRIRQQRHRKVQRKLERSRRVDGFAEPQVANGHLVVADELAVLDAVFEVEPEFA